MRKLFVLIMLSVAMVACVPNSHLSNEKENVKPFEFNQPDIVGTLGNTKVRMNYYVIQDLMYTDTPTPFSRDWEGYKSPKRTYDSVIHSFGFYLNYEKSKLRDVRNDGGLAFYDEMKISGTPWVLVGIDNNLTFQQRSKDILSRFVQDRYLTEVIYRPAIYQKQTDGQYGLEHYVVPLKDPNTDIPYDFGHLDDHLHDLFILRDKAGDIQTYMVCYIPTDVPNPPCRHKFFIREHGLDIVVSLNYSRHRLYDWHKIEQEVRKVMFDFVQNAKNSSSVNKS